MRAILFCGELSFLTPSPTLYISHGKNSTFLYTHKHTSSLISPNYATHNKRFVVSASSAPSLSGSGAEYSGIVYLQLFRVFISVFHFSFMLFNARL